MAKIKYLLRQLFCRHSPACFVRNIYGDEINHFGGKRSIWRCGKCNAEMLGDYPNRLQP